MACFYPLKATQLLNGEILIHKRTPGIHQAPTPAGMGKDLKLPCGRCIGCRIQRTQDWATRCLHESQQHDKNSFLTLTYESAPTSLSKLEHQKFIKRLRHHIGTCRYYMCGEYGEKLARPHYHYLIFGYDFPDRKYLKTSKSGEKLYRSEELEKIWTAGHAWLGDVTYESCAYVAAYVMKKINGTMAEEHYKRTDEAGCDYWLEPEFNEMSRRPGIAKEWWMKFHQDITTDDVVIKQNGGKMRPPRYYDKLLELMDPSLMALTKQKREIRARELADDNTPARLEVKETVTRAKMNLKKRNLEST